MKPGRELDALVAEKVFGAKKITQDARGLLRADIDLYTPCCPCMEDRMSREDFRDVPEYSTDIAIAWEVVEKLRSIPGMDLDVSWDGGRWLVNLGIYRKDERGYLNLDYDSVQEEEGETAPHAICLAALKAVGA